MGDGHQRQAADVIDAAAAAHDVEHARDDPHLDAVPVRDAHRRSQTFDVGEREGHDEDFGIGRTDRVVEVVDTAEMRDLGYPLVAITCGCAGREDPDRLQPVLRVHDHPSHHLLGDRAVADDQRGSHEMAVPTQTPLGEVPDEASERNPEQCGHPEFGDCGSRTVVESRQQHPTQQDHRGDCTTGHHLAELVEESAVEPAAVGLPESEDPHEDQRIQADGPQRGIRGLTVDDPEDRHSGCHGGRHEVDGDGDNRAQRIVADEITKGTP